MKKNELILKITAFQVSVIGYGTLYTCQVKKVISGNFDEEQIAMIILANDRKNYDFLSTHKDTEFEIGFSKKNENEPYSVMPLSGFVDKNRTSWEIKYLKE